MQLFQGFIIWLSQEPLLWMVVIYLVMINVLTLIIMWWDKRRARDGQWRTSEVTLLTMGFAGGAIGLLIGMFGFRHKTRKRFFQVATVLGLIVSFILYWIEYQAIVWHLYFI